MLFEETLVGPRPLPAPLPCFPAPLSSPGVATDDLRSQAAIRRSRSSSVDHRRISILTESGAPVTLAVVAVSCKSASGFVDGVSASNSAAARLDAPTMKQAPARFVFICLDSFPRHDR